jgi:hypothetical protein
MTVEMAFDKDTILQITLPEWLELEDDRIAQTISSRVSTVVVYQNGTRRWFLSQYRNWDDYIHITSAVQREFAQLFFNHGIQTLVLPLLGYDLLKRGPEYVDLVVGQGLLELAANSYLEWYHQTQIQVSFYGNWSTYFAQTGYEKINGLLDEVMTATQHYRKHKLLFGIFADEGLDRITALAKDTNNGDELLRAYYGQSIGPVDLIIGAGQPAIWDIPLLNINKANLYFLQAPTFCLNKDTLRQILYDCLYTRINDDQIYDDLTPGDWEHSKVLGLGQQTQKGWMAL